MRSQITVANTEPRRFAEIFHCLQAVKGIAANSPSALAAQNVGEHVSNGVYVRRNVQAPPLMIVASVHDDCEFFRRNQAAEAVHKLGATRAPGKDDDHAAL